MMIRKRLPRLLGIPLVLLALPCVAWAADESSHVRFSWSWPGQAAMISLPLPAGVRISEVQRVSVPGEELSGFTLEGEPAQLRIYPRPPASGAITFTSVDLGLESGRLRRFEFGRATVVSLEPDNGPLSFERSLASPGAGLYQAVALRNRGERDLVVEASRFLPAPLVEGRLLVATGEPLTLLSRLERAMTPGAWREARRDGTAYPRLDGFELRLARELDQRLAPQEVVVLVWTPAALPVTVEPTSFELRPVIEYRFTSDSTGGVRRLGLQSVVRSYP